MRATSETSLQQPPLHRIGVLKFIHHHGAITLLQRLQPGGLSITWVHGRQQASKADRAAPLPSSLKLLQSPLQGIAPHPFDRTIPEIGDGLLQFRSGQGWLLLAALARRSAPDAWVEVVVQQFLLHPDRAEIWGVVLGCDPAIHLTATITGWFGAVGRWFAPHRLPLRRRCPEALLQILAITRPELHKPLPAQLKRNLQLRPQRLVGIEVIAIRLQPSLGITIETQQRSRQPIGGQAGPNQSLQLRQGEGQQLLLPKLLHHFLYECRGIGLQLLLHGRTTVDRLTPQAAAAKAMDGGDVGGIELFEGHQHTADPVAPGLILRGLLPPLLQHRIRLRQGITAGKGLKPRQRILQTLTDAGAQFRCRRIREGHHQETGQGHGGLADQSQGQMRQGKGLAGAGARLQQPQTGVEGVAIGVKAHGAALRSWSSTSDPTPIRQRN